MKTEKLLSIIFYCSCASAVLSTLSVLSFGIYCIWTDAPKELVMDAVLTWYLSLIMFSITGILSGYFKDQL